MDINDRRIAVALQELSQRLIRGVVQNELTGHQYGVVDGAPNVVDRTVSVRLLGQSQPTPGFSYGSGLAPRDGDHVRAWIDPRGDKWIDVLGRDAVSEIIDVVTPPVVQPDRALGSAARIPAVVEGSGETPANVFLGVTVAASGDFAIGTPNNLTDGTSAITNVGDGIANPPVGPETDHAYWTMDLGAAAHVTSIGLGYLGGSSGDLSIDASADGSSWTEVVSAATIISDSVASGGGLGATVAIDETYRYWRLTWTITFALAGLQFFSGVSVFELSCDGVLTGSRVVLVPAPEAIDSDDATYTDVDAWLTAHALTAVGTDLAEAIRFDLGTPYRIVRARVVTGCATAGAKSYELRGATMGDYSDEVTLATMAFTAAGAYAPAILTPVWPSTTPYQFYRIVGPAEVRRVFTVELYETTAGDVPVIDPTTGIGALIDAALAAVYAAIITDHGALTGLTDDDHPQYTTAAELAAYAQPLDSDLTAFAALAIAADKLPYGTGSHTLGLTDLSAFIRTLLDDVDAAAARTTLGVGTGTRYEPLTSGASSAPELVFTADGRCVMVPVSD